MALKVFLERQICQIRDGGWTVLWRKLRILCRKRTEVILLPVFLPIILIIRLIRLWFLIRVDSLFSSRIGHFALNTEMYLCERDAGINTPQKPYLDLWYHSHSICNLQLARMWERVIVINPCVELLRRVNDLFPGYEKHLIGNNSQEDRDVHNLLERFPPHLHFLREEEQQGQDALKALGLPTGAPFVCLHVRDAAYLDKLEPTVDFHYHDYRNSNISNYVQMAQALAKRGYYVIRMGAIVKEAFPCSGPMIIDYATNGMRSDFMDIYLCAKCEFFVSTGTGIDAVAMAFRRPYVFVNLVPVAYCYTATRKHIFIVKKHWLRSEKRFMTFREIFESGAGLFLESQQFEENGIELIENTAEEIAAVVLEMQGRLRGTWRTTDEDDELQKRFWDIFPKDIVSPYNSRPLHGEIRSRIGAEFLRQNKALLE